ncbi:MAG TPA: energy transducer TonB [Fibrobacteraceae bacterium]|nr:energy transducer TonB [Fibrobacteraceae bacterium]
MIVLRLFGWISTNLLAIVIAVALSSGLFVILPVLQFKNLHAPLVPTKVHQITPVQDILPQHKRKEPPKEQKPQKTLQQNKEAPKTMARSRFAMDLAVGGGSGGGGVAVGGVGGAEGEQSSYQEGEADVDAMPLRQVAPAYPEEARKAGVSGTVRCLLTIDENGMVSNVEILESPGNYGFEEAIREAVTKWRFKPAEVNGIPVRQKLEQPFKF